MPNDKDSHLILTVNKGKAIYIFDRGSTNLERPVTPEDAVVCILMDNDNRSHQAKLSIRLRKDMAVARGDAVINGTYIPGAKKKSQPEASEAPK